MSLSLSRRRRQVRARRLRGDRGAALAEFALIAPFLLAILFAVIEFSWVFSQVLDMRHGAREGARLAAVNYQETSATGATQTTEMLDEICDRVDERLVTRVAIVFDSSTDTDVGDYATIRVDRDLETITGFFDGFLSGVSPTSQVNFRLEQDATWNESGTLTTGTACGP